MATIVNQEQYEAGYRYRMESLDRSLASWRRASEAEYSTESERQAVWQIAIRASQSVRANWGDRGSGPERLEHPNFDTGQRKAIMDWSHEHNHRLLAEERNRMRDRGAYEYGISY
jgi:hypothetical protein